VPADLTTVDRVRAESQGGWRGAPLPRGRHKLDADTVRASQRERALRAMIECVGQAGWAKTTVPEVIARARVSRNSFYEHFEDKTACFLAALDEAAQEILDAMFALASESDWITMLKRGMREYLTYWREQPALCRAYFVELPFVGPRGMAQREHNFGQFELMFRVLAERAREEQPSLPDLSPLIPRLVVVGVTDIVGAAVRADELDSLAERDDELVGLIVRLLADDLTARERGGRA
jgi:AcrR family transcriptional regulator